MNTYYQEAIAADLAYSEALAAEYGPEASLMRYCIKHDNKAVQVAMLRKLSADKFWLQYLLLHT